MDFFWQYFWLFFGAFGIGGVVLVIIFWPFIVGTKLGRWLLAAGGGALAVLAILNRTRQEGARAERARQEKENADFLAAQKRRDAERSQLSNDDLDELLTDHRKPPPPPGGG